MNRLANLLGVCLMGTLMGLLMVTSARAQQIHGDYIESRNADVYTGHCYAMSELNLVGDQAILAWRVAKGEWDGVQLDGLSVVGVARANGTLGSPYSENLSARSVLIVDERATPQQRTALASLARALSGDLLSDVVRTEVAPIRLELEFMGEHPSGGRVEAGSIASIVARSLTAKDHICGNEQTYYPPLGATAHSMPVVASLDQFRGEGLGVSWTLRGKRSGFVGHFAR
ncbi:MAG: DUF1326 domain-containing protein [Acidobacteria bacterium]|nr:DUF1326 domain-containing protein [Acidobacteriota bacterium]